MNKNTIQLFSNDTKLLVGSKVKLKFENTNFWIFNSTVSEQLTEPDLSYNSGYTFVLYANDSSGNAKNLNDPILKGDSIGLYSPTNSNFLSVQTTGLIFKQCNNDFLVLSDDMRDKTPVETKFTINLARNGKYLSLVNKQLVMADEFDDGHKGPNYPFKYISFWDYWRLYGFNRCNLLIGTWIANKANITTVWRFTPPPGYVCPGDMIYTRLEQGNETNYKQPKELEEGKVMIVFIKEYDNPADPYAKKLTISQMVFKNNMFWDCFAVVGGNYINEVDAAVSLYEGKDSVIPGYNTVLADSFQIPNVQPIIYGIRVDLIQNTDGSAFNNEMRAPSKVDKYFKEGGRQIAGSKDLWGGCDYYAWVSTIGYDRRNIMGIPPPGEKIEHGEQLFTHLFKGLKARWPGDTGKNLAVNILFSDLQKNLCCSGLIAESKECGVEIPYNPNVPTTERMSGLTTKSNTCKAFAQAVCKADKPTTFTSKFCQPDGGFGYCITNGSNPDAIGNDGKFSCDDEYIKFCNTPLTNASGVPVKDANGNIRYKNYEDYPDMCACFMKQEFLIPYCNAYAKRLGISKNKIALKALSLDTSDPVNNCNAPCKVIPLCRLGETVPTNFMGINNHPRAGKAVKGGAGRDRANCGDTTLCIQTVTVNNDGSIGDLKINQDAKCQNDLQKRCVTDTNNPNAPNVTVVYSSCTGAYTNTGNTRKFFKTIIDEKNQECGSNGDKEDCAEYDLTSVTDSCKDGIRDYSIKQLMSKVTKSDAEDSFRTLYPKDINNHSPNVVFDATNFQPKVLSNCGDCVTDYQPVNECYLDGNNWKQKFTKNKVIKQPFNTGLVCPLNSIPEVRDCSTDKDCELELRESPEGCVDGLKTWEYNIKSNSSGNGKTCDIKLLEINKEVADLNPQVTISPDLTKVTATVDCGECKVEYVVDTTMNNGKCFYDTVSGKYVIQKIAKLTKPAVGAGVCPEELLKLVDKDKKLEECNQNQDCEFNVTPTTDVCDDVLGKRTLTFSLSKPPLNKGALCDVVGRNVARKYKNATSSYNAENKTLTVLSECDKSKDCEIDTVKTSDECKDSVNTQKYKIKSNKVKNGKDCTTIAKTLLQIPEGGVVKEINNEIVVTSTCESSSKTMYIIIGVVIFLIILSISLFFILRRRN
jgi:hypothetical protein